MLFNAFKGPSVLTVPWGLGKLCGLELHSRPTLRGGTSEVGYRNGFSGSSTYGTVEGGS